MRALRGSVLAILAFTVAGMTGCQSTSKFASIGGASEPAAVAETDRQDNKSERIVTLEPDLEETGNGSTWSRFGSKLLNPFGGSKQRKPLPQTLAENEETATPGFE